MPSTTATAHAAAHHAALGGIPQGVLGALIVFVVVMLIGRGVSAVFRQR